MIFVRDMCYRIVELWYLSAYDSVCGMAMEQVVKHNP